MLIMEFYFKGTPARHKIRVLKNNGVKWVVDKRNKNVHIFFTGPGATTFIRLGFNAADFWCAKTAKYRSLNIKLACMSLTSE